MTRPMTPAAAMFKGASGNTLAGDVYGEEGPPVLLLHGGGQTRHAWKKTGDLIARIGRVAYAVYAARDFPLGRKGAIDGLPWIGFDDDHSYMPGQHWLLGRLGGARLAVRCNNWLVLHEAARAGVGLAVLPCFLGDVDPALKRVGGVVSEVFADQWLLVHRDLRALPRVRAVMDAVIELFQRERALLEGRS